MITPRNFNYFPNEEVWTAEIYVDLDFSREVEFVAPPPEEFGIDGTHSTEGTDMLIEEALSAYEWATP